MKEILVSLKAVSEGIRIRVILLLMNKKACVCELMDVFDLTQSKLSHHLITLRDAGLLQDEKHGKWNHYRLNVKTLSSTDRELVNCLYRWLKNDSTIIKDRNRLEKVQKQKKIRPR